MLSLAAREADIIRLFSPIEENLAWTTSAGSVCRQDFKLFRIGVLTLELIIVRHGETQVSGQHERSSGLLLWNMTAND